MRGPSIYNIHLLNSDLYGQIIEINLILSPLFPSTASCCEKEEWSLCEPLALTQLIRSQSYWPAYNYLIVELDWSSSCCFHRKDSSLSLSNYKQANFCKLSCRWRAPNFLLFRITARKEELCCFPLPFSSFSFSSEVLAFASSVRQCRLGFLGNCLSQLYVVVT